MSLLNPPMFAHLYLKIPARLKKTFLIALPLFILTTIDIEFKNLHEENLMIVLFLKGRNTMIYSMR